MNVLLMLYLTLVRGPQLMREAQKKEEEARMLKEEEDKKNGVKPVIQTCKKCDGKTVLNQNIPVGIRGPICSKCLATEMEHYKMDKLQMQQGNKMTPFLWFQTFMCVLGLSVFVYRNVLPSLV